MPYVQPCEHGGTPMRPCRRALPEEDPLLTISKELAAATRVLCLDELHVTDVADAMLLTRVFGHLLRSGCCVIFTSNRPARDLYQQGLSRRYFLPFIRLVDHSLIQLKARRSGARRRAPALACSSLRPPAAHRLACCPASRRGLPCGHAHGWEGMCAWSVCSCKLVVATDSLSQPGGVPAGPQVAGGKDYRRDQQGSLDSFLVGSGADQQLLLRWQQAVAAGGQPQGSCHIAVSFGRRLWLPRVAGASGTGRSQRQMRREGQEQQPQQQQQQQQQVEQAPAVAAALLTFDELCGRDGTRPGGTAVGGGALSAVDYRALCQAVPVVMVQVGGTRGGVCCARRCPW